MDRTGINVIGTRCSATTTTLHGICVSLARFVVGIVFLVSALIKLRQPYFFLATVYDYQILGPPWGRFVALVLPHIELAIAVCLLAGFMLRGALFASLLLAGLFFAAQSLAIARGLSVNCGCFGFADSKVSLVTLVRSSVLAVLLAAALLSTRSPIRARSE